MSQINEIKEAIEKVETTSFKKDDPASIIAFIVAWKTVLILVMSLIKMITGKKADAKINEFINNLKQL